MAINAIFSSKGAGVENINFGGIGSSLAPDMYLEMGGNSGNPFQTILGIKTFGLDDFEDALFTPSADSLGLPGLESSGYSPKNMDSILDFEGGWSLKSHPRSSQPSYSWTSSLPEGNLQHLSLDENYAPATDYTCTSNTSMENPRSTFQHPEPASAQCNIATEDIARVSKKKCSSMLITFGQNEGHSSDEFTDNIVDERDRASRPEMCWASKNLVAERKRRKKRTSCSCLCGHCFPISERICLQMGKASIINEAVDYIQSLQKQTKETGDDISGLRSGSTLHCSRSSTSSSRDKSEELDNYEKIPTQSHDQQGFKILQLDVTKVEAKTLLIQISWKKEAGIILHLIRALESLELGIINANHLTLNVCILSTVLAEVNNWELVEESRIEKIIADAVSNYGF